MTVRVAVVQKPPVLLDLPATLGRAIESLEEAAANHSNLVVFPEAYLPGYPTWIWRLLVQGLVAQQPWPYVRSIPKAIKNAAGVVGAAAGRRRRHPGRTRALERQRAPQPALPGGPGPIQEICTEELGRRSRIHRSQRHRGHPHRALPFQSGKQKARELRAAPQSGKDRRRVGRARRVRDACAACATAGRTSSPRRAEATVRCRLSSRFCA